MSSNVAYLFIFKYYAPRQRFDQNDMRQRKMVLLIFIDTSNSSTETKYFRNEVIKT